MRLEFIWHVLVFSNSDGVSADITSLGKAKASIAVAVMRKFILLIPLIYIMPNIFTADKTTAVYMAEPIADFFSVVFTIFLFRHQYKKIMNELRS